METQEEFKGLASEIKREGIKELMDWIQSTDFYKAPASSRFHGSFAEGLVKHSIQVTNNLIDLWTSTLKRTNLGDKLESVLIIGLFHDLCKINYYVEDFRNVKNALGVWEKVPYYNYKDQFPFGHGEKSVYLINKYMKLTDEEALAIRWHMSGYDSSVRGGDYSASLAYESTGLAVLLNSADMLSTYIDKI